MGDDETAVAAPGWRDGPLQGAAALPSPSFAGGAEHDPAHRHRHHGFRLEVTIATTPEATVKETRAPAASG